MKFKVKCIKSICSNTKSDFQYFVKDSWYEIIFFNADYFDVTTRASAAWRFSFMKEDKYPHFDLSAFHKLKAFI